jgi:ATP-dependent Clp protease adapter protein ClpS
VRLQGDGAEGTVISTMPADVLERPTLAPDLSGAEETQRTSEYVVIVFNNDYNTFDEVIHILQKATGCSLEEAEMETWEIDALGKSFVHHAEQEECQRVAAIIATIGIRVAVERV